MNDLPCPDLAQRNQQAWNRLYARAQSLVWGRESVGFLPAFIGQLGSLQPDDRVLDAATGEGRNLPVLRRLGGRLYACDASPEALRKISAECRAGVEVKVCDLRTLPYPDGNFQFVLLSDVIETLPEVDAVLAEIGRVLAAGGRLLCNIPGLDDGIAGEDMQDIGAGRFLYRREFFYQFFEPAAARRLLERHGLRITREEVCQWAEPAHPAFRDHPHHHVSRVFLAARTG